MFDDVVESPEIRPAMNIGFPWDIPTGAFVMGKHGEMICTGGLFPITGIGGRGNTFKSTIERDMELAALNNYPAIHALFYDTEPPSISKSRVNMLSRFFSYLVENNIFDLGRGKITDGIIMSGNKWFEMFKGICAKKISKDELKKNTKVTPFLEKDGSFLTMILPSIFGVDSLSMMQFDSVTAIHDKHEVGESGMNVEAMKSASAKSQMIMQLPILAGRSNCFVLMTAHMGDDIVIDPYAPPQKKLAFLKNKLKFKNIPEKFTFQTHNLWITLSASVLLNDTTKTPLYPKSSSDDLKGDTDLQLIQLQNLRGKGGASGMPFEIILSQREGVHRALTAFNFIKTYDRFGLGGNLQNYYLELVPDVTLSRTTVRSKLDSNPALNRAMIIVGEMLQLFNLQPDVVERYYCTPKELYEGLKEKGYDWNQLLTETRPYWSFEDDTNPLQFLSVMDLLRMHKGEYHPYWMESKTKAITGKTQPLTQHVRVLPILAKMPETVGET